MRTGLADPVFDSQKIFRAVLDATSHPGRVVSVPLPVEPPAPLRPATASLCLALVDLDTPLWLDTEARTGQRLTGPGIETETRVLVTALPEGFWPAVRRNHARFPRGVDVIFVARDTIVATPRSTRAVD